MPNPVAPSDLPIIAVPRPPQFLVAGVPPAIPTFSRAIPLNRGSLGIILVQAPLEMDPEAAQNVVAAAQDLVTGGQIPASRRGT